MTAHRADLAYFLALCALWLFIAFGGTHRPPEPSRGVTFDVTAPRPRVVDGPLAVPGIGRVTVK